MFERDTLRILKRMVSHGLAMQGRDIMATHILTIDTLLSHHPVTHPQIVHTSRRKVDRRSEGLRESVPARARKFENQPQPTVPNNADEMPTCTFNCG